MTRTTAADCLVLAFFVLLLSAIAPGEQVPVRHKEGLVHGFLVLRTMEGATLANGDLLQNARGDRVTSRLTFRFKDGSLYDETAVFSERGRFRLLRDHLVQKGPAFEHPLDASLDVVSGRITVKYTEEGKEKIATEQRTLPADLANGLLLTLLKNIGSEAKVSWLAFTPKPRLVKLVIAEQGEDHFSTGDTTRKALHYVVRVEIGGISGLMAQVLGKEPADTEVWILPGDAPAFVKSQGPLSPAGPVWRIEQVAPVAR